MERALEELKMTRATTTNSYACTIISQNVTATPRHITPPHCNQLLNGWLQGLCCGHFSGWYSSADH